MAIQSRLHSFTIEQKQGNFVRQQRVTRGLSQEEVAHWIRRNTNITIYQKRISQIELGSEMKLNEAFAIAQCFGFEIVKLKF